MSYKIKGPRGKRWSIYHLSPHTSHRRSDRTVTLQQLSSICITLSQLFYINHRPSPHIDLYAIQFPLPPGTHAYPTIPSSSTQKSSFPSLSSAQVFPLICRLPPSPAWIGRACRPSPTGEHDAWTDLTRLLAPPFAPLPVLQCPCMEKSVWRYQHDRRKASGTLPCGGQ